MTLEKERRSTGVFANCSDVELALQELKAANFPMHKVSVITRYTEELSHIPSVEVEENTSNISEESAGGVLGGLTGLFGDMGLLVIPGIGPVILAGAEATAIATILAGGAMGLAAGGLAGALLGLGIPQEQAQVYSDLVFKGYYLVIITATEVEIGFAKGILNRRTIEQWGIYEPYLSPKNRYKHAVGIFSRRQDAEKALSELRKVGFPMNQISVISQNTTKLHGLTEIEIRSSQNNYNVLGITDDLAEYYEHQLNLGNYLVFLNATDIYMAGARAILESNQIQNFRIYSQSAVNTTQSDAYDGRNLRRVISNF